MTDELIGHVFVVGDVIGLLLAWNLMRQDSCITMHHAAFLYFGVQSALGITVHMLRLGPEVPFFIDSAVAATTAADTTAVIYLLRDTVNTAWKAQCCADCTDGDHDANS